ncbi:MAG: Tad domain-containing protein [Terracidiphilus sp.]|nr:Tad domain-containing protein [Terracidiphilus sp.]
MRPMCYWHKKLRDESGNVLVFVALCMTVLMGFMALAIDVGLMFRAKRGLQIVADAAATAGALEYYNTNSGAGVSAAAQAAATANGVTNGVGGAVVTVINPVTSGAHTGAGTVEVDVSRPNSTFFMNVFGRSSMTVKAKAVAGSVAGPNCIWAGSVTMQGKSTISAPGCSVYSNSTISVTGGSAVIDAPYIAAAGSISSKLNRKDSTPPTEIQNAPKETPPPALLVTPPSPLSYGSCNPPAGATSSTKKGVTTITATMTAANSPTPGTCIGVGGAAKTNLTLTVSNVTLANGLYTFDLGTGGTLILGGNVSGGSAAGPGGITLNIYTGNFSVGNQNNDQLYAPSDGATDPYNGIFLIEPASNTGTINLQWGSSSGNFAGVFVAPGATMTLQDNGGSALVTGLYVGNLIMGPSSLNVVQNYDTVYPTGPFRTIALVE